MRADAYGFEDRAGPRAMVDGFLARYDLPRHSMEAAAP
jgi:hypothetical protein